MLFEVYSEKGSRLFYTSNEECLPPKEQVNSMMNAGYKIKLDGKLLTKKVLNELIKGGRQ